MFFDDLELDLGFSKALAHESDRLLIALGIELNEDHRN